MLAYYRPNATYAKYQKRVQPTITITGTRGTLFWDIWYLA